MATNLILIKRRMTDLICDLLSEINRLDVESKDCDMVEYNTIKALIEEKLTTLRRIQKILVEFK